MNLQSQHFRLDPETIDAVEEIVNESPQFENPSQFYRFAIRTTVSDEQEFGESE